MQQRKLGPQLISSALGLGCMGMSGQYGEFIDKESIATLRNAVDLGITLFDTADVYGPFANEALVGRALSSVREKVLLVTKFGMVRTSTGEHIGVNGRPEYVKKSCDLSLQRLGTDYIDLYIQHRVDPNTPIEETIGAMSELVTAGKVRNIGISEASPATIRRAHAIYPLSAVQSEWSLWSRDVEMEVIPTCRELGIGFMAYSPLGRGFLTGSITSSDQLADNDFRKNSPRFQGEAFDQNIQLVKRITEVAEALGVTPAQLALAWVLAQGDDVVPIPGTKRQKYLQQNVSATTITLTERELSLLDEAAPLGVAYGDRYSDMSAVEI